MINKISALIMIILSGVAKIYVDDPLTAIWILLLAILVVIADER